MPQDNPRHGRTRNGAPRSDNSRVERSRGEKPSSAMNDTETREAGARNVAAGLRLQKEMLGLLSELGQDWFARAAAETQLALRLPTRLTAARSFPDAVTAYQEWFGEWINRCSEDGQRLFSDGQKIVVAGSRCFTKERSALSG